MSAPLISIVTSSFNQGQFIGRTIASVRNQDYPNVEHIVVDGMSTDGTMAVLEQFPHLKVIREPDRGQADAINKGFRVATGQILTFLNSDDTLEPGALSRVATAIDPKAGCHVVMGRCRFIDEDDRFLGVEHPSSFESHRRVLEIWKGHFLPQPAIFWTRAVWDTCGPLDVDDQLVLDYDLFCRFSRRYRFCQIDEVLANYRLHLTSKSTSMTDEERLERSIAVSRRYWGSPLSRQYWQIAASYASFRFDRRKRGVRLMRSGGELWSGRYYGRGFVSGAAGVILAPDVVTDVIIAPAIVALAPRLSGFLRWARSVGSVQPQTQAWFGFSGRHGDGWAGPTLAVEADLSNARVLRMFATTDPAHLRKPLRIEAFVDRTSLGVRDVTGAEFALEWPLNDVPEKTRTIRLVASTFMVPNDYLGNGDFRPLSYRPSRIEVEDGEAATTELR